MGKTVTVNCGSWTTYYRKEVWDNAASYCSQLGGGGGGSSSNTTAQRSPPSAAAAAGASSG